MASGYVFPMNVSSLKLDGTLDVSKLARQDFVLKVLVGKQAAPATLAYEWAAREPLSLSFTRARVEMLVSNVTLSCAELSPHRTRVKVELSKEPRVDVGTQDWDAKLRRRCRTNWLCLGETDVGCEALPSGCRPMLLKARTHELVLNHTLSKVQEYLSKAKLANAPAVKRPLSTYNQLQKALAVANKKCKKEKMKGSDGARCDGCGGDEDEEGEELDVICERCLYTACDSCAVHHSRGACYCKKGW